MTATATPRAWSRNPKYDASITPDAVYNAFTIHGCFTDAQAAARLDIAKQTLWEWRRLYPEFKAAYIAGKTIAEARYVEQYEKMNLDGKKFQAGWSLHIKNSTFGTAADIERDASETDDERVQAYNARINMLQEKNKKDE